MTEIAKNYLTSQLKRLDELFNNVPTAKQACIDLNHTFKDTVNQIESLKKQIEMFDAEFNAAQIEIIKSRHLSVQQIENNYQQAIISQNDYYQVEFGKLPIRQKENHQKTQKAILDLIKDRRAYGSLIQKEIAGYKRDKAANEQSLEKSLAEKKDNYLTVLSTLYDKKTSETFKINASYHELLTDYHHENKTRLTQETLQLNEQDQVLDESLKFHEKDNVIARQVYFNTLTKLNNKITQTQNLYKKILKKIEKTYQTKIEQALKELEAKKAEIDEQTLEIQNNFETAFKQIDSKSDQLKIESNEEELKLKNKYNRDVTAINIEFHKQKDLHDQNLIDLKAEYDKAVGLNIDYKRAIRRFRNDYQRRKNKMLRIFRVLESETEKQLKVLKKKYLEQRIAQSKENIKKHEQYRYQLNLLDRNKNNSLKYKKGLFNHHQQNYDKQICIFNKKRELEENIIDGRMQLEIIPLESQASLANHIYDLEANYQSVEQNFWRENNQRQKALIEKKSKHAEIDLMKNRDKINIKHNYDIKIVEINNYLDMETEKNNLVLLKRVLRYDKQINEADYNINALKSKHKQELKAEKSLTEEEKLNTLQKITDEEFNLKEALLSAALAHSINKSKLTYQRELGFVTTKETVKSASIDYARQQKTLSSYFQVLNLIWQESKRILMAIKDSYYLINNTKEFNEALNSFYELLLLQKDLRDNTMDFVREKIIAQMKTKIEELTISKYQKQHQSVLDEYEKNKKATFEETANLEKQIIAYRDEASVLQQKAATLENQNDLVLQNIKLIRNQVRQLKRTKINKQRTKTIKNLRTQVKAFKKQIEQTNSEIKLLNYRVEQTKTRILMIDNFIQLQDTKLIEIEKNKEKAEKQLKINQYYEGEIYYKSIQNITDYYKDFKQETTGFLITVDNLFDKLKSSKTTKKSFQTQYLRLQRVFNRQQSVNSYFQQNIGTLIEKQYLAINTEQEKISVNLRQAHQKTLFHLTNSYKKKTQKINKNIKQLNSYRSSVVKLADFKLKKSLAIFKEKQTIELEQMLKNKAEITAQKKALIQEHQEIAKAFQLNRNELLLAENNTLKESLKKSSKASNLDAKKAQLEINQLTEEIYFASRRYLKQLNFFADNDDSGRKKLIANQASQINRQKSGIRKDSLELPNYDRELSKISLNSQKAQLKLLQKKTKSDKTIAFVERVRYLIALGKRILNIKKELS